MLNLFPVRVRWPILHHELSVFAALHALTHDFVELHVYVLKLYGRLQCTTSLGFSDLILNTNRSPEQRHGLTLRIDHSEAKAQ